MPFNIRFGVLRLANENKSGMAFNLSYLFDEVSLLDRIMRNLLTDFDQTLAHSASPRTRPEAGG
jgi:hypothetical protein